MIFGDFIIFLWPSQNIWTLRMLNVWETSNAIQPTQFAFTYIIYNIWIFASKTLFILRLTFKMMSGKSFEISSDNLAPGFRFPVSEDQPQKSIGLERRRQDSRGLNPLSILQPNCLKIFRFWPSIRDGVLCSGMLLYLHLILK